MLLQIIICFRSTLSADCIISFDANFQLKHIRDYDWRFPGTKPGSQDPEMMSPLTMEILWVDAEGWKKKVEEVWQPSCKAGTKQSGSQRDPEDAVGRDKIMPGLKVTEETYDGCKQSFIAADEHHEKASKKYFDDTSSWLLYATMESHSSMSMYGHPESNSSMS